jgi:uncharacterized surface protein with fasciclin (FAS1) repeats
MVIFLRSSAMRIRVFGFFLVVFIFFACNNEDMPPSQEGSLWEIIDTSADFSLLKTAIVRAGLDSALRTVGPITLFAPNNAAVTKTLQELGLSSINQVPVDFLQAVLLYHLIPGRNLSTLLATGPKQTLLQGFILDVRVEGASITLNNDFKVITANVDAKNGVLHIIDGMMIPPTNTLLDVAQENGYTVFISAVVAAGLESQLVQGGPFTLMVPSNAAFNAYLTANNLTMNQLLTSPNLQEIIGYHVIPGLLQSSAFQRGQRNTILNNPVYFSQAGTGNFLLNGVARIARSNLTADNGIIHEIEQVLTRPRQNIAEYVLERSLAPNPEFSILVKALIHADLLEAIAGRFEDNLTFFAPSDQAFEGLLREMNLTAVDQIPQAMLKNILLYHLTEQRFFTPDLREGASIPTLLSNASVVVNLADNRINDALMIPSKRNILMQNGVIHAIDQVLIPQ